jgi:hypothetical protein
MTQRFELTSTRLKAFPFPKKMKNKHESPNEVSKHQNYYSKAPLGYHVFTLTMCVDKK